MSLQEGHCFVSASILFHRISLTLCRLSLSLLFVPMGYFSSRVPLPSPHPPPLPAPWCGHSGYQPPTQEAPDSLLVVFPIFQISRHRLFSFQSLFFAGIYPKLFKKGFGGELSVFFVHPWNYSFARLCDSQSKQVFSELFGLMMRSLHIVWPLLFPRCLTGNTFILSPDTLLGSSAWGFSLTSSSDTLSPGIMQTPGLRAQSHETTPTSDASHKSKLSPVLLIHQL